MTIREKLERAALGSVFSLLYAVIRKNPEKNLIRLANLAEKLAGGVFHKKYFEAFRHGAADAENVWRQWALGLLRDVDKHALKRMVLAIGLGAGVHGTRAVRENREKYGCNVPFTILFDPTSACNLHCKGCWSAEYGHKHSLTLDEMRSIIAQGKMLGTHNYMLTGGEPLLRKADILTLCRENPDCSFLAYTNATLVDVAFCEDIRRVGNLALALSIEGTPESNDARRGEGAYAKTAEAMHLLRENRCLFGISVCYTRDNFDSVTGDAFLQDMIAKGAKFALYFHYMPVGKSAVPALLPTPDQRKRMYHWLRRTRNGKTGNPIFVLDFQNDGEYVGGCIAGGRNYFHINSAGDIEPCVFIHYSDSNVRRDTLLEALRKPLFTAYYHNQPFNDNHLRPCPMLENPECLRKIITQTGASSTDLIAPESADTLCARCDCYAADWQATAEELWTDNPHPSPKTQYWRDRM
ncbi:MAG: radical SAM protein [Oscillospiraceae bacterium]|jgi:MoaA/NifB/PqqE/SkfB family radical SAM enzyme|nr:radical SAM protein [Oscillospiraceae bacterium]